MSLGMPRTMVGMERLAGRWSARPESLAAAGLVDRYPFCQFGRRTVTSWLRAAGISTDFDDYYYFLASVGRNIEPIATQVVFAGLANVAAAGAIVVGHRRLADKAIWPACRRGRYSSQSRRQGLPINLICMATCGLRSRWRCDIPQWGALALPLRAMLYVRKKTMPCIPRKRRWPRFATKLQLAARLIEWIVPILKTAGKTVWVVIDGGYTKRPFLRRRVEALQAYDRRTPSKRCGSSQLAAQASQGPETRTRQASQVRQDTNSVSPSERLTSEVGARSHATSTAKLTKKNLQDVSGNLRSGRRHHPVS